MPKSVRPIIDRSLRVSGESALIDSPAVRADALALIESAGFSPEAAVEAHATLSLAMFSYRNAVEHSEQLPTAAEKQKEIRGLIRYAKDFIVCADRLGLALQSCSMSSRKAILYELSEPAEVERILDPRPIRALLDFQAVVSELVALSESALVKLPAQAGGRPKDNDLRDLLFRIAIVWHLIENRPNGVTVGDNNYRGPLLEFAVRLLTLEQIEETVKSRRRLLAASPQKLGKLLYQLQGEARAPKKFEDRVAESSE